MYTEADSGSGERDKSGESEETRQGTDRAAIQSQGSACRSYPYASEITVEMRHGNGKKHWIVGRNDRMGYVTRRQGQRRARL